MYSILGMNLFAGVKEGEYLTRYANFHNWPAAMLVLFRQITGENWDGIMADCMVTARCVLLEGDATNAAGEQLAGGSWWDKGDSVSHERRGDWGREATRCEA